MSDQHRPDEETGNNIVKYFTSGCDLVMSLSLSLSVSSNIRLQVGCVTVLVPPDIDQNLSSGDVTVTEVKFVITLGRGGVLGQGKGSG